MKVAVCVITYQRPEGLKRLMEDLNELAFDKCGTPSLEVIVVDNDSAGLACKFCEEIRSDLHWPLKCSVELRRGIPYARNKAVACAQEGHADFVAFIDDDEVPEPPWLDELLYVQRSYDADVVAGPVLPRFTTSIAPWMKEGKFFERRRLPTGTPIDWASTCNVLVRSEVFEKMDKGFDERFALSGGSSHFFESVHRAGYKMVWADDALVHEWIPKSRANVKWLLQRQYRYGNNYSLRKIESEPSIASRARLAIDAGKQIVKGLLRLPRSLTFRRTPVVKGSLVVNPRRLVARNRPSRLVGIRYKRLVRSLLKISYGAGMLAGIAGRRYEEYRRIHGI